MIRNIYILTVFLFSLMSVGWGQIEGCMNTDNSNYNPEAYIHVSDSCAVQIYGCTDVTALNYDATATNICSGISEVQCCTATTAGCTDPNYLNYNENANSDDGSCSGAFDHGCMTSSACNYNPNATADCSNVTGGTNTNCCASGSTTTTECVQDLDNDNYQDAGTESQLLPIGNCGCDELGYGWEDQSDLNGEAIWGCTDPICPEYDPEVNSYNGNCCLGYTAEDSTYMESEEYNLLGGYTVDLSDCEDDMGGGGSPDGYHNELYVFLGWGGEYHEEFLSIHELSGYRAEPQYWPNLDSPADCEDYAGGSYWFCGNQIADTDSYSPCEEEYFAQPCDNRDECWWEAPECRWNTSQWVGDACWQDENQANQTACTADPGCQWDDGGLEEYGEIFWQPTCYFECWGLSQDSCENPALVEECIWAEPDPNDGYCSGPATNYDACDSLGSSGGQCYVDGIVDPAYTTEEDCYGAGSCTDGTSTTSETCTAAGQWWNWANSWWEQGHSTCWGWEDWDTGNFICECEVDNVNMCAGCQAECEAMGEGYTWTSWGEAQCEQKPYEDACNSYGSSSNCNDAPAAENCQWDYQGGWCFKEQGADCWMETMQNEVSCVANSDCEWWIPPGFDINNVPPEFQDVVAQNPGVCNFYDWCHDYYCWEGECDESGCKSDGYCRWDEQPGQPASCVEDAQAQYCECYIEWSQSDCQAISGTTWDAIHNECMWNIDEYACNHEDNIMLGPEDGNIDCSEFINQNISQYTEWNGIDGVCEMIFEDTLEGTWSIVGNTLCIEKIGEFEEEACNLFAFEECQCNPYRCSWLPQPTSTDPDAGTCAESSEGTMGRSRPSETCLPFELVGNGVIHFTQTNDDGSTCTVIFLNENVDYYCDENGNVLDCLGECGGSAQLDECGICNGDGSSCDDCEAPIEFADEHWSFIQWVHDYYKWYEYKEGDSTWNSIRELFINTSDTITGCWDDITLPHCYIDYWESSHSMDIIWNGDLMSTNDEDEFKEVFQQLCGNQNAWDTECNNTIEEVQTIADENGLYIMQDDQYYDEWLKKYNMWLAGWDDNDSAYVLVEGNHVEGTTPNKELYKELWAECNNMPYDDASWANIIVFEHQEFFESDYSGFVSIETDGYWGGIQLTLHHGEDFAMEFPEIVIEEVLFADYNTSGETTIVVIVTPPLRTEIWWALFLYSGDMTIGESIVTNSQDYIPHEIIYFQEGDVNFDGIINILDIVTIVNYIVGTLVPDELEALAADYNADGTIDILDVVLIVNSVFEY